MTANAKVITTQDAFIKRNLNVIKKGLGKAGGSLSRIGKALMFPIAMLPFAAILLRVGGALNDTTAFSAVVQKILLVGANSIFTFLPVLFATGMAFGLSRDSRGEAAVCGFVGMVIFMTMLGSPSVLGGAGQDMTNLIYGHIDFGRPAVNIGGHMYDAPAVTVVQASPGVAEVKYDAPPVMTGGTNYAAGFHTIFATTGADGNVVDKYDSILAGNVLCGIVAGGLVATIYNRFNGIDLPKALSFFNGRRLVPVLTLISMTIFALVWAIVFPWVGYVLFAFSGVLGDATGNHYANAAISGVYGIINRLLIPFGLHHVPNTLFWFVLGSHPAAADLNKVVNGDINIFLSGASLGNTAGTFQSGFFPIMMFGLPALVAAIWFRAEKDQRAKVLGLLGGAALISFFTGITEPIEFAFLFVAPALFFVHALLTGLFSFITGLFGIQLGFGFSAGLLDYVLSIPKSLDIIAVNKTGVEAVMANPGWLFLIGGVSATTYFFTSSYLIKRFNWNTPGRGNNRLEDRAVATTFAEKQGKWATMADEITEGIGGLDNVEMLEWCATRLRLVLKDVSKTNDALIKKAGALGTMHVGTKGYQIVIGTQVEQLGNVMTARIAASKAKVAPAA